MQLFHTVLYNQDIAKYEGLRSFLPLTDSVMLKAFLSLVDFPNITGLYSIGFLLESAYGQL